MSNVRLRRLSSDFDRLREYVRKHPRLELVQTEGSPPELYQLRYRIRGLRMRDGEVLVAKDHMVEIALPRNYPRTPPVCRMLTPIFHPNIAPHAICIGDHWSAGEPLSSIVGRIGEMIAYQSYNTKSPLNGEAAKWVSENIDQLPLDPVSLLVEESAAESAPASREAPRPASAPKSPAAPQPEVERRPPPKPNDIQVDVVRGPTRPIAPPPNVEVVRKPPPAAPPPQAKAPSDTVIIRCSACEALLKIPNAQLGKPIRCSKCRAVFTAGQ